MTIIAAIPGLMIADSMQVCGRAREPVAFPKIVRCKNGSLVGASGRSADCWAFTQWMAGGQIGPEPELIKPEEFDGLLMTPDGVIWRMDDFLRPHPTGQNPALAGTDAAQDFVAGAMAAGAGLLRAMELVLGYCTLVGGPLQVEKLGGTP